jgi:hypothetical protein
MPCLKANESLGGAQFGIDAIREAYARIRSSVSVSPFARRQEHYSQLCYTSALTMLVDCARPRVYPNSLHLEHHTFIGLSAPC